jgi:hypothetical protein
MKHIFIFFVALIIGKSCTIIHSNHRNNCDFPFAVFCFLYKSLANNEIEKQYSNSNKLEFSSNSVASKEIEPGKQDELAAAKQRILELEERLRELELRIPKKTNVKYLNYQNRKRILVSISSLFYLDFYLYQSV